MGRKQRNTARQHSGPAPATKSERTQAAFTEDKSPTAKILTFPDANPMTYI